MSFDLATWIRHLGLFAPLVVWAIIFAESGLLIGFFLPGDSLLFTAGILASQGVMNLWILIFGSFIAAVIGNNVGYEMGHRFGRRLFQREDSLLFHKKHLVSAQKFYETHGRKTIILARFLPVVRTFATIVAGIGAMDYRIFLTYNVIGGALWTVGITLLGYFLGRSIPDIDRYLLPIILGIIVLSVVPSLWHLFRESRRS